jgi:hypothetical protein
VKKQSLYLAWADHQDGHFVLANQRGQKVVSYNLIQLGRRINRQLLTKSGTTELAALDRSILSRINVFKPRKLENSQIDAETGALDQDHFTKQLCLAAEDARAKLTNSSSRPLDPCIQTRTDLSLRRYRDQGFGSKNF